MNENNKLKCFELLLKDRFILTLKCGGVSVRMLKVTNVFWYAVVICAAIVLWGSFFPDQLNNTTSTMTNFIYDTFGWYYMFVIMSMIILCLFFMFSRFGKIKLG